MEQVYMCIKGICRWAVCYRAQGKDSLLSIDTVFDISGGRSAQMSWYFQCNDSEDFAGIWHGVPLLSWSCMAHWGFEKLLRYTPREIFFKPLVTLYACCMPRKVISIQYRLQSPDKDCEPSLRLFGLWERRKLRSQQLSGGGHLTPFLMAHLAGTTSSFCCPENQSITSPQ